MQGQTNGLPQGIEQLPPQRNPVQQQLANIHQMNTAMGGLSMTNLPPDIQSNLVQMLQGLTQQKQGGMQQPQGMPPQGSQGQGVPQQGQQMDTNAILQQAQQAIQQGADPQKVHMRLQQMGVTNGLQ